VPCRTPLGRARRLTNPRTLQFQVLWHEVQVEACDETMLDHLALISHRAQHSFRPLAKVTISVRGSRSAGFSVFDAGDLLAAVATCEEVVDIVFTRIHRRAAELASLLGWLRVHGAVVGTDDGRVTLIGPSGSGKTTISMDLLSRGARVEADESFVVRGGEVIPVARRLHVQPGTRDLLIDCSWLGDAPEFGPEHVRIVDPTEHGFDWTIRRGPVGHVVVLRRTEGPTTLEALPFERVLQEVIGQALPVLEPKGVVVSRACELARSGPGYVLHAGPDREGPRLIMDLVRHGSLL
jgi:hypothetical protein